MIINMPPGKLISIIAVLILLILAAEAGYYWGFNRGLKNAPATAPIIAQIPGRTPAAIFSGKDPADIQAAVNAMALLFKPQVIDHLKNVPVDAVWWSSWSISIGGKLLSLNDKTISLELASTQGVKTWILPESIRYQIYNETTRQETPVDKETMQPGDMVGFSVDFDTRTGEILEARLTKNVK